LKIAPVGTAESPWRHQLAAGPDQLPVDRLGVGERIEVVPARLGYLDREAVSFAGKLDSAGDRGRIARQKEPRLELFTGQAAGKSGRSAQRRLAPCAQTSPDSVESRQTLCRHKA